MNTTYLFRAPDTAELVMCDTAPELITTTIDGLRYLADDMRQGVSRVAIIITASGWAELRDLLEDGAGMAAIGITDEDQPLVETLHFWANLSAPHDSGYGKAANLRTPEDGNA